MTVARLVLWAAAVAALLVLGLGLLVIAPRWSESAPAPRSDERSIGLFDAHLHLSVQDVRVVEPARAAAGRRVWIVTARARNDAARIDIDPGRLDVLVRSRDGRVFAALERVGPGEQRFERHLVGTLRPGESREQSFVFELPGDVASPVLVVESTDVPLPWLPRPVVRLLGGRVELGLTGG